jgi:hypothetical protein
LLQLLPKPLRFWRSKLLVDDQRRVPGLAGLLGVALLGEGLAEVVEGCRFGAAVAHLPRDRQRLPVVVGGLLEAALVGEGQA